MNTCPFCECVCVWLHFNDTLFAGRILGQSESFLLRSLLPSIVASSAAAAVFARLRRRDLSSWAGAHWLAHNLQAILMRADRMKIETDVFR